MSRLLAEQVQPQVSKPRIRFIPALACLLICYHSLVNYYALHPLLWLDQEQPTQIWRILSAQMLHTDLNHLLWNLGGLVLLGTYLESKSRRVVVSSLFYGVAGVALWFYIAAPTQLYGGLSGALNALMVITLYDLLKRALHQCDRAAIVLVLTVAAAYLVKNVVELTTVHRLVIAGSWPSAPGAHAAGFFAGLIWLSIHGAQDLPRRDLSGQAR